MGFSETAYQRKPFVDVDNFESIFLEECQNITPNVIRRIKKNSRREQLNVYIGKVDMFEAFTD